MTPFEPPDASADSFQPEGRDHRRPAPVRAGLPLQKFFQQESAAFLGSNRWGIRGLYRNNGKEHGN